MQPSTEYARPKEKAIRIDSMKSADARIEIECAMCAV